jgi:UDP-glucose 4-epimerase
VYGEPERVPIDESHPLRARSAYGVSKVAAEAMVASAVRRYGLNATSLRCGNAYGPGQDATRPQGLVAKLLDCATSGRPIEIWGDGGVERDFIHVDDIATVITVLAGRPRLPFAINVGSGQATSVRDVIEIVTHVTGQHIHVAHRAGRAFDVARVVLDTTLLRSITPFRPMPVETGIRATWASARASSAA